MRALLAVSVLCSLCEGAAVVRGGAVADLRRHVPHRARVISDPEPLVVDYSDAPADVPSVAVHLAAHGGASAGFQNPKNGTPWFRYKKASEGGVADHDHFSGLASTGDFEFDILRAHNVVRERGSVQKLKWSDGLQQLASNRVHKLAHEGCYIQHAPLEERSYEAGFEYVGENLYKVINMVPTGVDVVDAWYAEIEDYNFGAVGAPCVKEKCAGRASPPCMLGHFTQVMWAASTHVGCGRAECPSEAKRTFITVCNYGPGGNIVGDKPFSSSTSLALGGYKEACPARRSAAAPAYRGMFGAAMAVVLASLVA